MGMARIGLPNDRREKVLPRVLMKKRVTLKVLAEKTGFHVTTVSGVLRGKPNFNRKTIRVIHQAAKQMGFFFPERCFISYAEPSQTEENLMNIKPAEATRGGSFYVPGSAPSALRSR